jgi:flagellar motility protein MotE (MotC chaperone)
MPRKQKTINYLYKTTCLMTGRYYIGIHSTNNLEDGYMGSGKRLRRSIRKYGIDNHKKEILEFFDSRELLIEAEKKAITPDMITDINCMNIMSGGTGGFISVEQQKHRASCAGLKFSKIRKNNPQIDKEYREKLSKTTKKGIKEGKIKTWKENYCGIGKKHSDETKKKIGETNSVKQSGEKNSQYGTCWITKDGVNKKIKKEDLDSFIQDGWIKGRVKL